MRNYFEKMQELRKEDEEFNEIVRFVEDKIEEQIDKYNNTKTVKERYVNGVFIKVFVPAFPMTPIQWSELGVYLSDKYRGKTSGDYIKIKKCLFSNRYKIFSKRYDDYDDYGDY